MSANFSIIIFLILGASSKFLSFDWCTRYIWKVYSAM